MLPRVKINFENGNLGLTAPSPDGLLGIMAVVDGFDDDIQLGLPYQLFKLADLATIGLTEANNPQIHKVIREFYAEAGDGTEVWLLALPNTVLIHQMVNKNNTYAKTLMDATNGRLRGLVAVTEYDRYRDRPTLNGLFGDVIQAMQLAQELAEWYTVQKFSPLFVVLSAAPTTSNYGLLQDLTAFEYNRVCVLLGDTFIDSLGSAVGVLAGKIAVSPVQRNIGRYRDGALKPQQFYINDMPAETVNVETLHNTGYITVRTYPNQSGYYFTDDCMATKKTDDYSQLTARRTIDKAYRIAYATLLNYLLDEVPVNANGTLQVGFVKNVQAQVEGSIAQQMTAKGELSGDVATGDKGVQCFIDANQNIIATSTLNIRVRVRPFGYPRYIDVYLGFTAMPV